MAIYRFSDFRLDTALRRLTGRGGLIAIGARAFDLLAFLLTRREGIVSREEIMSAVWAGTTVGANNLNVQVSALRRALGAEAILTVYGRGLRFGLDVNEERARIEAPELPACPSVVVLPFLDLGCERALDWLPDSVVENITTELSRFRDLFVVARNSAFVYRDVPRDVRVVSRELGVRYIVEGSVWAAGPRMRVTVQLVDALTGGHAWAETFEGDAAAHGDMQHRIAQDIVASLAPQIDRAETARIRRAPVSLDAFGLAQRGWSFISAGDMAYDRAPRAEAEMLARTALKIDPHCGLGWRTIAWAKWWDAYHATTESFRGTIADGLDAASRAVVLDCGDHHAWRLKGQLGLMAGEPSRGLDELRRAHEINPNCAITRAWLGVYEATHGDAEGGVAHAQSALRLSPRDPSRASLLVALGFAQFSGRDYRAAGRTVDLALSEAPRSATPLVLGAIAWVGTGQIAKARAAFAQLDETAPKLAAARLAGRWLSMRPDYLERSRTFLRIAADLEPPEAATALR